MSLTTSKRGARKLVYFTRGRGGRAPFSFQTAYVPVMSVCGERVRVRVMGRASPAMYALTYCSPESLRHETRLVRIVIGHFSKKGGFRAIKRSAQSPRPL